MSPFRARAKEPSWPRLGLLRWPGAPAFANRAPPPAQCAWPQAPGVGSPTAEVPSAISSAAVLCARSAQWSGRRVVSPPCGETAAAESCLRRPRAAGAWRRCVGAQRRAKQGAKSWGFIFSATILPCRPPVQAHAAGPWALGGVDSRPTRPSHDVAVHGGFSFRPCTGGLAADTAWNGREFRPLARDPGFAQRRRTPCPGGA